MPVVPSEGAALLDPVPGVFAWTAWKAKGLGLLVEGQQGLKPALPRRLGLAQAPQFPHSILATSGRA